MSVEIFLDTNVFESASFSYQSERMTSFLAHCSDSEIKLKITDVVKHEVEKRIRARIEDTFEKTDKKSLPVVAASIGLDPSKGKLSIIETLITKLHKDFHDFIEDNDVEIMESNCVIKDLTTRYFEKKPPFTEQKKHEFPDAIILLSIKNYLEDHPNKTILTISNDGSFADFSQAHDITNFNFISAALNYLIQNPDVALTNAFNRQMESIKTAIRDQVMEMSDFTIYSYDSIDLVDVDDVAVDNATIDDLNIIKYDPQNCTIHLESNLSIEFSCKAYYPDPDTLHYDKEDGKYYSFTKCTSDINFSEKTICELEIQFDEEYDFDIIDVDLPNKEFEFYLDEKHIVHTDYDDSF